jgi:hypothetical protein
MTAATLECPHGLTSDLHLDGYKLSAFVSWLIFHASTVLLVKSPVALVVFHVPYTLVDVPSKWIVKGFRYGFYLPLLIICSGLVSTFPCVHKVLCWPHIRTLPFRPIRGRPPGRNGGVSCNVLTETHHVSIFAKFPWCLDDR